MTRCFEVEQSDANALAEGNVTLCAHCWPEVSTSLSALTLALHLSPGVTEALNQAANGHRQAGHHRAFYELEKPMVYGSEETPKGGATEVT